MFNLQKVFQKILNGVAPLMRNNLKVAIKKVEKGFRLRM